MSVIKETIDDFCEFVDELVELMLEDWERVKKFVKEYKNYVFWFVVLSITMQITDIGTLGRYVKRMCEEEKNVQRGGNDGNQVFNLFANNAVEQRQKQIVQETGGVPQVDQEAAAKKAKKEAVSAAFEKGKKLGQQGQQGQSNSQLALQQRQQQAQQKKNEIKDLEASMGKDDELKKTEKQISFFQRMKQKVSGVDPQGKKISALGPLFGGMDKAMSYMQNIMAVLTFILTAIGIISLPVFIFLIVTYFVIKSIASKIFIL